MSYKHMSIMIRKEGNECWDFEKVIVKDTSRITDLRERLEAQRRQKEIWVRRMSITQRELYDIRYRIAKEQIESKHDDIAEWEG